MKRYFLDLWNRLESVLVLDADSSGQRRSRATIVVTSSLSVIAGVISGANSYISSDSPLAIWIPLTFALIVGMAILIYFTTGRFSLLLYAFLFMILFTPFAFHLAIGGFASPITVISWSILAPIGALLVLSVKRATWWFFSYLTLLAIALHFDSQVKSFAIPAPHGEFIVAHGINSVCLSIIVFITMGISSTPSSRSTPGQKGY
jgi:hypothetical protein